MKQRTALSFGICVALVTSPAPDALSSVASSSFQSSDHAAIRPRVLTFQDRVAARRAVEEVYWRHRIWPDANPEPKPPMDEVFNEHMIRELVIDDLRKSKALEHFWGRPLETDAVRGEFARIRRHTQAPGLLHEVIDALGNDLVLAADTLARPALSDRLLRNWHESDARFHSDTKKAALDTLAFLGDRGPVRVE